MNIGSVLFDIFIIAMLVVIYFFLIKKESEKTFITWMTLILIAGGAVLLFSAWKNVAIEYLVSLIIGVATLLILLIANLSKKSIKDKDINFLFKH